MRKAWAYIIPIVLLLVLIGVLAGLFILGDEDVSALERLRDVSIVFIAFIWVFILILMAVLVGVAVWLLLLIKDRVIPLLATIKEMLGQIQETLGTVNETALRVKGTTEFVSEEVAQPVIGVVSRFAQIRATAKMFVQPDSSGSRPPADRGGDS
jgi:hypothetical protein